MSAHVSVSSLEEEEEEKKGDTIRRDSAVLQILVDIFVKVIRISGESLSAMNHPITREQLCKFMFVKRSRAP